MRLIQNKVWSDSLKAFLCYQLVGSLSRPLVDNQVIYYCNKSLYCILLYTSDVVMFTLTNVVMFIVVAF